MQKYLVILAIIACGLGSGATAAIRVAIFHTELERKGPGILLRDIARGTNDQVNAVQSVIAAVDPDILLILGFDYDLNQAALTALRDQLSKRGIAYPHLFSKRPNTGMPTGLDMDGDGYVGDPSDAQGYGRFSGQGGMAILSKWPIDVSNVQDHSAVLWRDLPDALLPFTASGPFPSSQALKIQRLSTTAHWAVPITIDTGDTLYVLAFHAGPPVFDGPEDRNGKRNHDELMFWEYYLGGAFGPHPAQRFVLMGGANQDPSASQGRTDAIRRLIAHPALQDPIPRSVAQNTTTHDPSDTVYWPPPGPGGRRVDYVLPSRDWRVTGTGVYWPKDDPAVQTASRHRLVWVDLQD